MTDFAGTWFTSFGPMTLRRQGGRLVGTYGRDGTENSIDGTLQDGRFVFSYREAHEQGTGWFALRRHGAFAGEYLADGNKAPLPWQGWRDFDGLWDLPLGRVRLVQEVGGPVTGIAEFDPAARIEGQLNGQRLTFTLAAPKVAGHGMLELDPAGLTASGEWRQDGQPPQPLQGQRALGMPGLIWLVVLEAYWQRALDEREFAFGHMLRELFARLPRVQVRHRFFQDEPSLLHWSRQLLFLPEPAYLVITGHGEATGLSVGGKIIELTGVLDSLRLADSLRLLHFSCCLIGQDAGEALKRATFPISGYTTTVGWAESALGEFIYLNMMLERGLPPATAAQQLPALVRFAGTEELEGSPYRPAGFRYFAPSN